jgi:hypothetical protein
MYRKIFIPSEQNNNVPVVIPNTWYGKQVEVIVSLVYDNQKQQILTMQEKRKKREELNKILDEYPLDLSEFKFDRDQANDFN